LVFRECPQSQAVLQALFPFFKLGQVGQIEKMGIWLDLTIREREMRDLMNKPDPWIPDWAGADSVTRFKEIFHGADEPDAVRRMKLISHQPQNIHPSPTVMFPIGRVADFKFPVVVSENLSLSSAHGRSLFISVRRGFSRR
jgi:hypothetical protein